MYLKKRIYIVLDWLGISFFLLWIIFNWAVQRELTTTDFFIGSYLGIAVFEEEEHSVQYDATTIRVTKIGDKMSFSFSDSIPTIYKVQVKQHTQRDLINLNACETNYIRLDTRKLEILFNDGTKSWFVYADRL